MTQHPVRQKLLPYSRQSIDDDDVQAITDTLQSDWLTTGPKIFEFEKSFANFVKAKEAVAVSSGTAALHAAMFAIGIKSGDEVIVPSMTFAATANAVVFCGGTPVFVDCDPKTLLIDPEKVESAVSSKTKAIIAVDYAGQPCDYNALQKIATRRNLTLVADACHSLGGVYHDRPVGSLADISCFSFHPVKPMTTGEGGMATTDDSALAEKMRDFRNHCITSDHRERQEKGSFFYEQVGLGYNYRITDFQCALGLSQLKKVPAWTRRRQEIAKKYDNAFSSLEGVTLLPIRIDALSAYHLYVIQLDPRKFSVDRSQIFKALREENIGVNVHYIPVHLHPFYKKRFGTKSGQTPVAEAAYERIISIPMFAAMSDQDIYDVIEAFRRVCEYYAASHDS